jgi:D-alanyl-D-alanine carboxypeptidase
MNKRQITVMTLLCIVITYVFSEDILSKELDLLLSQEDNNSSILGNISISKNNVTIYSRGIGKWYKYFDTSIGSEFVYRIGSITKTFTATIIMYLVQNHEINLDTTIDNYFPDIDNSNIITIRDLLVHQSGIKNFTTFSDYNEFYVKENSKEDMISRISKYKSLFTPGSSGDYSNTNYLLLGYIAEIVSKKEYAKLLEEIIVKKIGLKNTRITSRSFSENNENKRLSDYFSEGLFIEKNPSASGGSGWLCSTTSDLNRFITNLFEGNIISKDYLELMTIPYWTVLNREYGAGMWKQNLINHSIYGHDGSIDWYFSKMFYFPERKIALSVCIINRPEYLLDNEYLFSEIANIVDKCGE